ncbi:hypothetical protein EW145_g460 [Phellinidium pouzarii]|uniref:Uncharacterized protein n=1 Tax=Phellinidium pouzarii TaxID=167371 RepID=A0A4S4LK18_9AGAM|nr:hypothetical protein EW145_g460 [Phellinidium pouzarii]
MGEFNSASCGGISGISDTFGATMWALDYVPQLASVGFDGAYIHTRERGISYNLFDPPAANDSSANWTTLPTFYALLPVAEALGSQNGFFVMDLNINDNSDDSVAAGYGVYDGQTNALNTMVLFNYADTGKDAATFPMPSGVTKATLLVRLLTAASLIEKFNISWAGKTFEGVGDGIMVDSGYGPDQRILCDSGCENQAPSPGIVVVWLDSDDTFKEPTPSSTSSTLGPSCTKTNGNIALPKSPSHPDSLQMSLVIAFSIYVILYI